MLSATLLRREGSERNERTLHPLRFSASFTPSLLRNFSISPTDKILNQYILLALNLLQTFMKKKMAAGRPKNFLTTMIESH